MKKKILMSFLIALIFIYPIQSTYMENRAHAMATKIATKVAQQAIKEVVKDAAINKAINIGLDTSKKIVDSKYNTKTGYMAFCMDYKAPDGTCKKPMQIKETITSSDKQQLNQQASTKLDAKIGGALYATKWGKFLDWIVPIYAISAIGVSVDYLINGEDSLAGLINDVAMDALMASGIIEPLETVSPVTVDASGTSMESGTPTTIEEGTSDVTQSFFKSVILPHRLGTHGNTRNLTMNFSEPITDGFVVEIDRVYSYPPNATQSREHSSLGIDLKRANSTNILDKRIEWLNSTTLRSDRNSGQHTFYINKTGVHSRTFTGGVGNYMDISFTSTSNGTFTWGLGQTTSPPKERIVKEFIQMPKDGTDTERHIIITESGNMYEKRNTGSIKYDYENLKITSGITANEPDLQVQTRVTTYTGGKISQIPFTPNWEEDSLQMPEPPLDHSVFRKDETTLKLPPIDSFTYKDSQTGTPATIVKNPQTGETEFQTPEGQPIPEDNVSVEPGTGYTPTPEGYTYTPTNPNPDNPNSEPVEVPRTTPQPVPEPETPPPTSGQEEPPLEPFPDGEKCDAKLQFPIFSPLKEQFSTSFPFSIPWDIGRAIDAGFSGIGNEKPSYTLDLAFMGGTKSIDITIPDFFDDWVPFVRSVTLFTFDVMIMFGIYRFVKGAGS